jgi:hypothetical protein
MRPASPSLIILGKWPPALASPVLLISLAAGHLLSQDAHAAKLTPATIQAWDRYFAWADEGVRRQLMDPSRFLIADFLSSPERQAVRREIESGAVVVRRVHGVVPYGTRFEVPEGEIHHWWGTVLVPDVTLEKLLTFLQDYDHHAGRFTDVERSRLISKNGNHYRFYLRLKRSKAIVTAYYNTEQECDYFYYGSGKASSRSIATKIAEIEDAGEPSEHECPPGEDRGFLWRLVSWWRFQQTDRGVIVECESASLSRDIPAIVKLIPGASSYIRSTPKESLESVLTSVRAHLHSR